MSCICPSTPTHLEETCDPDKKEDSDMEQTSDPITSQVQPTKTEVNPYHSPKPNTSGRENQADDEHQMQTSLSPNVAGESCSSSHDDKKRVLVINTGGTIGMTVNPSGGLSPQHNALVTFLSKQSMLHDAGTPLDNTLVLPLSKENKRIVYTVLEFEPLLDSSNVKAEHWIEIGKKIEEHYEKYNGFVILHGTDTMAYTASALSFMCENLRKPVIVTGSQVPIYELRNDGRENLLGALLIAGQFDIHEVCLYFHYKLYRGNRVTKVDAEGFDAFTSPNLPPLAHAEVDIKINWDIVRQNNTTGNFTVNTELDRNVGLLRIFPGITADTVTAFLSSSLHGIVLETYGSGNAPDNDRDLLNAICEATNRGLIMINCTQCLRGMVTTSYATGQALSNAGLVSAYDMTSEAAFSKLSYVLAKQGLTKEEKKKMLTRNLRGEMTDDLDSEKLPLSFIQAIAKFLKISNKKKLEVFQNALVCTAAKDGDIEALKEMSEMGSDLSMADYGGRTPLHIAACEGKLKVVEYLLSKGATVNARDRFDDTPLCNAVRLRQKDVVMLLRNTGAQWMTINDTGPELCSLAARGDVEGLEICQLAGIDLTNSSYDGKTPIDVARASGHTKAVEFLEQVTQSQTQDQ